MECKECHKEVEPHCCKNCWDKLVCIHVNKMYDIDRLEKVAKVINEVLKQMKDDGHEKIDENKWEVF